MKCGRSSLLPFYATFFPGLFKSRCQSIRRNLVSSVCLRGCVTVMDQIFTNNSIPALRYNFTKGNIQSIAFQVKRNSKF